MSHNKDVTQNWPDLSGRLLRDENGLRHVLPVRVYFEDTDFSGVVYHASYVRWCERGRSDLLRLLGDNHLELLRGADGRPSGAFVVRRMALEFLKPARIDEVLEVTTEVVATGAASLDLAQTIRRAASKPCSGEKIFEATVMVVLISTAGKPMRVAEALRTALVSGR